MGGDCEGRRGNMCEGSRAVRAVWGGGGVSEGSRAAWVGIVKEEGGM